MLQLRFFLPSSIVLKLLILCGALVGTHASYGQKLTNRGRVFKFVTCPGDNRTPDPGQQCYAFNRQTNTINIAGGQPFVYQGPGYTLLNGIASTILSSKIIFSGTVLRVDAGRDCSTYMWYVVTQTNQSSSVLIYNPTDIGSEYCDYATPGVAAGTKSYVYLVLPVNVVWAEVVGYNIVRADNFHKAPSQILSAVPPSLSFTSCDPTVSPAPVTDQTLRLCDRDSWPASWFYKTGAVYNVLIQPGTGSGAISYTPVIGNTAASYAFDVQVNPSFRVSRSLHWWNGWIGTPFVLEKSGTQAGNLDSLTGALSYEIHPEKGGNIAPRRQQPPVWSWVILRAVQAQVRTGVEYAPTTPHDLNFVQSEFLKMPIVLPVNKQPSALTLYPLFGLEQVHHVDTHMAGETSGTTREVAGGDASFRLPFGILNNLFGDKPVTTDFSYRYRWLSNPEPTTNWQAAPSGTKPTEFLSAESHSYTRASFNAPLSSYVQFKVTVQHGALPPNFHSLGYTLQLGLSFSDPGSAEH